MSENKYEINDEVDLKELFLVIWKGKIIIIVITAIFAITSIVISLSLTNFYKSESIVTLRNNSQNQGMFSQFSNAASLIGVNLQSSSDEKAVTAIELIKSRYFVKHLISFDNVLPSIMAAKSYDVGTRKLNYDPEIYDSESGVWLREPKNGNTKPSYLEVYEEYHENLMTISQNNQTGFISINIEHISPIFAKEFLELIIRETNFLLKRKDMELSSEALKYLKSELSKTSLVEIRESIHTLIEAQLETQMMTKINEDYVLTEVEPPFIPERKSKPIRSIIVILSTIFGSIMGIIIILLRYYFFKKSQTDNIN